MNFQFDLDLQQNNLSENQSQKQYQQSFHTSNDYSLIKEGVQYETKRFFDENQFNDLNKEEISNKHSNYNQNSSIKDCYLGLIQSFDQLIIQTQKKQNILQKEIYENSNLNEYQIITTLTKNNNAKIQLAFHPDQKYFKIKKCHLIENDYYFNKECRLLKYLDGYGITLDIKNIDQKNRSFEQIAGKSDLFILHQNYKVPDVFEVFFLIMLKKLNKMHELGIAHADIKPQNILISYQNEPFFIDFDSSEELQDFDKYLESFTYEFNLNVYVQKVIVDGEVAYKTKKFKNKEEVKLCDQTQLALTFLYLLCQNQNEIDLFYKKEYNRLLKSLFFIQSTIQINKKIILFIISTILNRADETIEIFLNEVKQIFLIDHSKINYQLRISSDITYDDQEKDPIVNRIDKFSGKIIYLLSKYGFQFNINPQDMTIIPQIEMEEYKFICQKHQQIEQYQKSLINKKDTFNLNDFNNLFYYLNTFKNQKCKFLVHEGGQTQKLLNIIKKTSYLDTHELTFILEQQYFQEFKKILEIEIPYYYIEEKKGSSSLRNSIQEKHFKKYIIKQKIKIGQQQDSQIKKDSFEFLPENQYSNTQLEQLFNEKLIKHQKKQQNSLFEFTQNETMFLQFECNASRLINKLKSENQYGIINTISLNMFYKIKDDKIYFELIYDQDESKFYQMFEKIKFDLNFSQLKKQLTQLDFIYKPDYEPDFFKFWGSNDEKESKLQGYLQNQFQKNQKIVQDHYFIFQNHNFQDIKLWLEIENIIQSQSNNQLKLILVDCQFIKSITEKIQELILKYSSSVQYLFLEYEKDTQLYSQKQDVFFKFYDEISTQQRLNILFFKESKQYQKQCENKNQIADNILKDQQNQFKEAYLFFKKQMIQFLENVIIPEQAQNISKIQQQNKKLQLQICNIKETLNQRFQKKSINQAVTLIIEKINNQDHYQYIQLQDGDSNYFEFLEENCETKVIIRNKYYAKDFFNELVCLIQTIQQKQFQPNMKYEIIRDISYEDCLCEQNLKFKFEKNKLNEQIYLQYNIKFHHNYIPEGSLETLENWENYQYSDDLLSFSESSPTSIINNPIKSYIREQQKITDFYNSLLDFKILNCFLNEKTFKILNENILQIYINFNELINNFSFKKMEYQIMQLITPNCQIYLNNQTKQQYEYTQQRIIDQKKLMEKEMKNCKILFEDEDYDNMYYRDKIFELIKAASN